MFLLCTCPKHHLQDISVDGMNVLKRGAPSWVFGGFFRRSDSSYRGWTTDDGFMVTLGDEVVWRVKADNNPSSYR